LLIKPASAAGDREISTGSPDRNGLTGTAVAVAAFRAEPPAIGAQLSIRPSIPRMHPQNMSWRTPWSAALPNRCLGVVNKKKFAIQDAKAVNAWLNTEEHPGSL